MIEMSRRTLVLHPGALGDVLLAIPALRALRAGAGELVLAAQPRIGRLLASLGVVDRGVGFDTLGLDALFGDGPPSEPLRALVAGARIVSWFGRGDAAFVARLSRLAGEAIVSSTAPPRDTTVWQHVLASLGSPPEADRWRDVVDVTPSVGADGRRLLAGAGWNGARPLVMLHPGAGGVAKRWAVEGFTEAAAALVDACGVDVVVHEGPADREAAAALRARLRVPALVLTDPPLDALAGAMRHASLWIGNDSGVSHLAAAVGARTLALFTDANLAWRPWARDARVRVVGVAALRRDDVDGVVGDAIALLRAPERRAVGAGDGR
jgi:ADP-heptose:LPS heptosyltransferase